MPKFTRILLSVLLLLPLLAACSRQKLPDEAVREFDVNGIVREPMNPATGEIVIEHENIPGYMPSQTMPFPVKQPETARDFTKGDGAHFRLVVTESNLWIEGLKKIAPSTVQLGPPKQGVRRVNIPRVRKGDRCPAFTVIDQTGWPLTIKDYRRSLLLLNFMFTRCPLPSSCPLMAQNFAAIQKQVAADPALAGRVKLLSVSFDPDHDTPARLAEYASQYTRDTDSWRFATGTAEELGRLTSAFSVYIQPDGETINHGLCTALIGPDGTIVEIWRGSGWTTDEVMSAIRDMQAR